MRKGNGGHASPAAKKQLGLLLRQLRMGAGKKVVDVVTAGIMGETKLWKIETGRMMPDINDVLGLCWVYGVDPTETERFVQMVREITNGTNGFWEAYGGSVPPFLSLSVGMEQTAHLVRVFQPEFVHGLLQTPAYAFAANKPGDDARANADLRLARQQAVIDRKDNFRLEIVLGAGALARQVGGRDVMKEQIERLLELNHDHRFGIRVLAWEVGMHQSDSGPYTVFEFAPTSEDPVVYVPLIAGGRYIEGPKQVGPYQQAFSSIWTQATPVEEYTS